MDRKYGAKQSPPDVHDRLVSLHLAKTARPVELPEQYSLEEHLGPAKNQLGLGSCTGFAYAGMREFLYRRYNQFEIDRTVPAEDFILSPMFLYYAERELEGTVNQDNGASMRTGCKVLNHSGICLETQDPYSPADYQTPPTAEQRAQALVYRAGAYHRVMTLREMKECIFSGYVFSMGFLVYQSFEDNDIAMTGKMPMPATNEECKGGHAVLAYGYNDTTQCLSIRNSWGANWGDRGSFYMPYAFADNPSMLLDCWILHLGKAWG